MHIKVCDRSHWWPISLTANRTYMKTDRSVEQPIFMAAVASMSASLSPPFSHAVRGTYLPKPRDLTHRVGM